MKDCLCEIPDEAQFCRFCGERVVGIFPHPDSALRLISAVLAEIHDEWLTGPCFLDPRSQKRRILSHNRP